MAEMIIYFWDKWHAAEEPTLIWCTALIVQNLHRPITTKGDLEHQTLLTWHQCSNQANFFVFGCVSMYIICNFFSWANSENSP